MLIIVYCKQQNRKTQVECPTSLCDLIKPRQSSDSRLLLRAMMIAIQNLRNHAKPKQHGWRRKLSPPELTNSVLKPSLAYREVGLPVVAQRTVGWDYWKIKMAASLITKWGLSTESTAKIAILNMGHPSEIFFLCIYLICQIFGTS